MLSREEIEKFIQEMTEVRPDKLNKEALRLYNTIMQILDKNEQLETENKELKEYKQKLIEKLEKDIKKNNEFEFMPLQIEKAYNNYYKIGRIDEAQEILEIAKEKNNGIRYENRRQNYIQKQYERY